MTMEAHVTRLVVVDDHALHRDGTRRLIAARQLDQTGDPQR